MPEKSMADQVITKQELIDAQKDAQTLEDAVNGEPGKLIKSRTGREFYSLASVPQINTMTREEVTAAVAPKANKVDVDTALSNLSTTANKYYSTLVAANADIANIALNQSVMIGEAANSGLWEKKTAGATSLTKSPYDPLTQSKQYADALSTTELTITTYLNTLAAGNYFLSTGNLNALVDAGNFAALGYPADTVKLGSVKINVVRKGSFTYQTMEFPRQGRILTRQGEVGGSFYAWVDVVNLAVSKSQALINQEIAKKFGSIAASENLNDYKTEGVYAISTGVLKAGIESGEMSLPNFFTAVGGAILIVAKSGGYPYQVIIATRQKKIATRQGDGIVWTAWENMLDIVPTFATPKKTFLTYGSSSFSYMSAKIKTMIESFNATYISDAIGGQILETMQAHQGSNQISIVFNNGVTALNNVASAVTVTQKDDIGSLKAKGSFTVTLSNGLKGTLNLDANTFTARNATEIYNVGSLSFDVDFGYLDYAQTAYHIFNIGKNNITMGNYTAQQVLDETNKMIDFVKNKGNQNFIIAGHFVDTGMVASQKQVVLDVNAALKAKYGMKYFDMQDYLMSAQIWTDLNITPTQDDLDKQAAGELAVSLSRDSKHLSSNVDTLMVDRLKQKLQDLNYL